MLSFWILELPKSIIALKCQRTKACKSHLLPCYDNMESHVKVRKDDDTSTTKKPIRIILTKEQFNVLGSKV